MLDRIRAIVGESTELLNQILNDDFEVDIAIRWLESAWADLDASENPTDAQIEDVFIALAGLQARLTACMGRVDHQHHSLIENLTDRIDIFLFHHRLS